MLSLLRKLLKSHSAATVIEFAIIAPILLLFTFAILEFGLTIVINSTLNQSLKSAARIGMVTPYTSEANIRDEMRRSMGPLYDSEMKLVMCVVPNLAALRPYAADPMNIFSGSGNCIAAGSAVTVDSQFNSILIFAAEYPWGGISGLMTSLIPTKLYATTVVKSEYFER